VVLGTPTFISLDRVSGFSYKNLQITGPSDDTYFLSRFLKVDSSSSALVFPVLKMSEQLLRVHIGRHFGMVLVMHNMYMLSLTRGLNLITYIMYLSGTFLFYPSKK